MLAVETIRGVNGKGKVTAEIRHFVSSAKVAPEALLAAAIRSHWRVENGLHWVLSTLPSAKMPVASATATPPGTWPCSAGSRSISPEPIPH